MEKIDYSLRTNRFKSNKNVTVIYTKIENITKSEPVGTVITENTKTIVI